MADATGPRIGAEAAQLKILLGDEDATLIAGLSEVLGSYAYLCDQAQSWSVLMDQLQRTTYDLLILEMRLGQVDLVQRFAEVSASTAAPIVFLTKEASEVDRILALEKGAATVLRKPISGREIVAQVRAQLRRSPAPTRPPEPQPTWRISCGELGLATLSTPLVYSVD